MPAPDLLPELLLHDSFLRALARELVGEAVPAEDLAQDVWVTALRTPPRSGRSLRGWLASVARHLAANTRRGLWRRTAREQAAARPERAPSTDEVLAREHTRELVVRAVLGLEEPFREVVLLRFYEGLPPRVIARRLGIPGATVRSRLLRGLDRLRGRLDGSHGGDRTQWFSALLPWKGPSPSAPLAFVSVLTMKKLLLIPLAALVLLLVTLKLSTGGEDPLPEGPSSPAVSAAPVGDERAPDGAGLVAASRRGVESVPAVAPARPSTPGLRVYPATRRRGTVTGDVVAAGGLPAASARVVARPELGYAPPGLWIGDDRQTERSTITDAQGRFELVDVDEGPTRVTATQEPNERGSALVIVSAVEANAPVRLELAPATTRGDDVRILVVDGDGAPVPDAQVEVFGWSRRERDPHAIERGRDEALFAGRTDARGQVAAKQLGLESGVVWARAPDGRVGQATAWDLRVDPATVRVAVGPAGAVQGRLTGPGVALLEGAVVSLHALAALDPYYTAGGRRLVATLRGEEFELSGLAPGTYGIALTAPRGARLAAEPVRRGNHPLPNSADMPHVEIAAGKTATPVLEVLAGGGLAGKVVAAGQPVARARVRAVLAPRSGDYPAGFVLHGAHVWRLDSAHENAPCNPLTHRLAWTDAQGRYELPGMAPGRWRVELSADGFALDRRMEVEIKDGAREELTHELVPAGVLQVAANSVTYLGVLAKGERAPVALAITWGDFATFPGLAAGTYAVARFHSDERVAPKVLGEAEVVAGRTTWLDLRTASLQAWITGRVLAGDHPVAGATVSLYPARVVTDAQGMFRLGLGHAINFRFGSQILVGHRGLTWSFAPQAKEPVTRLELELQLGTHELPLFAVDGQGAAVGAQLDLSTEPKSTDTVVRLTRVHGTVSMAADQASRIGPLPAGVAKGAVVFAGALRIPFESPVPRTEPLRIQEPPRGRVRVRVVREGKPVPGAKVYVTTWLGKGPAPARYEEFHGPVATRQEQTGEDGVAAFEVAAGDLYVHTSGGFMAQRPATRSRVEPGAQVELTIEM